MLHGMNYLVLDLETQRSAGHCRHCGLERAGCEAVPAHPYTPIGWDDHLLLGLSIGCVYDYQDDSSHWFDPHTLQATMRWLVERQPLLVTFNGERFDLPLMAAVAGYEATPNGWDALRTGPRPYDLLALIGTSHPELDPFDPLHSLDKLCEANGYPRKAMTGAQAPELWAQGRYAEVLNYCQADVLRTRLLFEQVCLGQSLRRLDGMELWLPVPDVTGLASTREGGA